MSGLLETLRLATTALLANKLRATLTTTGVVIGVTTVMAISAVIAGLDRSFSEQIEGIGSSVLYIQKYPWIPNAEWWSLRNRRNLGWREHDAVAQQARSVEAVAPMISQQIRVVHRDRWLDGVAVTGTNEQYRLVYGADPEDGRFLMPADLHYRKSNCVVGSKVADELFEGRDPLGERVKIAGLHYRVIGVLPEQGEILGFDMDSQVFIPIGAFARHFGSRRSIDIAVKVSSTDRLDDARDELTGILRRVRRVPPDEEDDFSINEQSLLTNLYRSLTAALYTTATVVGGISLLVGGIGIMNIMTVAVTERVKEIGIRKAVGARRSHILGQFLSESIVVSGVGGLLGVALGFIAAWGLDSATPLHPVVTVGGVALGLGFSAAVGVIFGVYPAARAAALNPVDALAQGSDT
ncbi:MAG: hypothetical protein CME06_03835 [Gemmatimonadetes bacterium]|nr:hypothetical protein [Gemmatimonadota bacterium]